MGLTPCGKDWLIAALDPFHDNRLEELSGYPDNVTTSSIVRQVKGSLEISTLTSEDVDIVLWPTCGGCNVGRYTQTGSTVALPGIASFQLLDVAVYKHAAGTGLDYTAAPTTGMVLPTSMQPGKGRLIGMGIEVINTTAPINRSGTLYCWRLPGIQERDETLQYFTGAIMSRVGQFRRVATPPALPSDAMLIPGTRSWASEEGCYLVSAMEQENPPLYPTQTSILYQTLSTDPLFVGDNNVGTVVTGNATPAADASRLTPYNLSGVMLRGNNPNSKFTLNVVWYYEEFPDIVSDVLTLATPSCAMDPVALRLYAEVLNSLPVAVPSSWNASGDWWWDVVSAIKDHAANLGGMIGGAPGRVIGMAASTLAGWGRDRYLTAPGSGGSGVPATKAKGRAQQKPAGPKQGNNGQNKGNQNGNGKPKMITKNQIAAVQRRKANTDLARAIKELQAL